VRGRLDEIQSPAGTRMPKRKLGRFDEASSPNEYKSFQAIKEMFAE
jgi:hypothetical protein